MKSYVIYYLTLLLFSFLFTGSLATAAEKKRIVDHSLNFIYPKIDLVVKSLPFKMKTYSYPAGLRFYNFTDIALSQDGTLYLASRQHGIYLLKDGHFQPYSRNAKLKSKKVLSLCFTEIKGQEALWIGTGGEGVYLFHKDGEQKFMGEQFQQVHSYAGPGGKYVFSMVKDGEKLWCATNAGLSVFHPTHGWYTHRYARKKNLYDDYCQVVAAIPMNGKKRRFADDKTPEHYDWRFGSHAGNEIWVGTLYKHGGVIQFRDKRGYRYRSANGVSGAPFTSIAGDENIIWAGTKSNGVYRFEKDFTVAHYKLENGFPSRVINDIIYYKGHTLMSTPRSGLIHYNLDRWIQYNSSKTLIPDKVGRIIKGDSKIYLMGENGLIIFPDFINYTRDYPARKGSSEKALAKLEKVFFEKGVISNRPMPFSASNTGVGRILKPGYVRPIYQPKKHLDPPPVFVRNKCLECHHFKGWAGRISFAGRKVTENWFRNYKNARRFLNGETRTTFEACTVNRLTTADRKEFWKWLLAGDHH